jgi:hypothetical protein
LMRSACVEDAAASTRRVITQLRMNTCMGFP